MTDLQLWLAIGVPMAFNGALIAMFWRHIDKQFDALERKVARWTKI